MRIFVETVLPAPPGRVWEALQLTEMLQRVAAPVLHFRAADPAGLPRLWNEGREVNLRLVLVGVIPLGRHTIRVDVVDRGRGEIQTRESGFIAPVWNHTIRIVPVGDRATRYSDEVEVRAGLRTVFVWLFAQFFYRHRQRRWRFLLREGTGPP